MLSRDAQGVADGITLMHVDDVNCLASEPKERLTEIGTLFEIGEIELLTSKSTGVYIGMDILWDERQHRCELGQDRYVAELKTTLTDKERRRVFSADDLKVMESHEANPSFTKAQQEWTGKLGWIAKTQPQLSVVFGETSRNNTRGNEQSVIAAQRACEYAKQTYRRLILEGVKEPMIVWWVDGSFSLKTCEGRIGYEVQILDVEKVEKARGAFDTLPRSNLVAWKSKRCKQKLCSTTAAELIAIYEAVKDMPAFFDLIGSLWGQQGKPFKPKVLFLTDSQGALGWLRKRKAEKDPAMQGKVDLVCERIDEWGAEILWVDTKSQRADRQTKFIAERTRL